MCLEPDIEENGDECVIRIAPKPIKIKIKPLLPPPPPTETDPPADRDQKGGTPDNTLEDRLATSGEDCTLLLHKRIGSPS